MNYISYKAYAHAKAGSEDSQEKKNQPQKILIHSSAP